MNNLAITSQAIEAVCVLNLKLKNNGYGIDTLENFEHLFNEFCAIFTGFPEMDIPGAIEFWEMHQDECGEPVFG